MVNIWLVRQVIICSNFNTQACRSCSRKTSWNINIASTIFKQNSRSILLKTCRTKVWKIQKAMLYIRRENAWLTDVCFLSWSAGRQEDDVTIRLSPYAELAHWVNPCERPCVKTTVILSAIRPMNIYRWYLSKFIFTFAEPKIFFFLFGWVESTDKIRDPPLPRIEMKSPFDISIFSFQELLYTFSFCSYYWRWVLCIGLRFFASHFSISFL